MKLRLAAELELSLAAVTETFGILAARGAGKSNAAAVMAEEMFAAKLPFVVIDPVRAWWGLRSSADGKGPGLAVPIFGGRRGDVPLERGGGQLVADLVVDQRLSCVLDLSDFESEGAKKQFLLDFARRLYQRNEHPLHLFLEEADDYIPQKPMGRDEPFLLRAWENIVRRGRARGLGCTLITQRSAVLNKNVLTQVQTLIPMRTTGPQDIAAIREWVKYHHQGEALLATLPSLEDGEAWVWSPHFLKKMVRVRFRRRATFDSGATPTASASPRPPATLADVDLGALKTKMAATIERAKAEDPRELRRQVQDLQRKLQDAQHRVAPAASPKRIEVPVLKKDHVERLQAGVARIERAAEVARDELTKRSALWRDLMTVAKEVAAALQRVGTPATSPRADLVRARQHGSTAAEILARPTAIMVSRTAAGDGPLTGPERKILTALAQHGERSVTALALLTGYAAGGGAFRNPLSALRSKGYADGREVVRITDVGRDVLGTWEPLPTGEALLRYWLDHLPGPEAKLLGAVAGAYPKTINVEDLAAATGYEVTGGAFRNPLSRLRTLQLVSGRADVRASEELF